MVNRTALGDLTDQIARINEMVETVPSLVKQARLSGASWTQIGLALGVTRQAAQQRYAAVEKEIDAFGTRWMDM